MRSEAKYQVQGNCKQGECRDVGFFGSLGKSSMSRAIVSNLTGILEC